MLLYTWHNAMNRLKIKETMSHIVFVINISFKNLSLAEKIKKKNYDRLLIIIRKL